MRKETGDGLKAMKRHPEIEGGLLKALPPEVAKFMLDLMQSGHDSGAIRG